MRSERAEARAASEYQKRYVATRDFTSDPSTLSFKPLNSNPLNIPPVVCRAPRKQPTRPKLTF